MAVDAKGYGRADALRQGTFQEAVPRLVREAAEAAGLGHGRWEVQRGGDSQLAVLPVGASEPALVDPFMRALDAGLRAFNHDRVPEGRLRLRAAVHFGTASPGPNGFLGRAPVEIGRILDSAALRGALAANPDAYLAVAVSATVFDDVVREAHTTLRPEEFTEVRVEEKEFTGQAWIWIPGTGTGAGARGSLPVAGAGRAEASGTDEPAGGGAPAGAASPVVQHFHGTVNAAGAVFGVSR
ncbi:hypothetical protein AC230_26430 [Streptomyces caatingaensis]|uniref:Guanylate cyclase domain-containing protein n=1 Tax=Streptomyces caatingaensis TaxID=1678637 RepID=A0A0K9XAB7_9ACTN|nr:hypothetical protein AC230_26430 [Streptomyces caatingaensis]